MSAISTITVRTAGGAISTLIINRGPAATSETTATLLEKLGNGTKISATHLPDALSGSGVPAGTAVAATLTVNPTGADNSILYTAGITGPAGNSISITYASNGPQSNVLVTYPLASPVVGTPYPITITPGVGGATAAQVIAAVNDTMASVTASASGIVTGVVAATSTAYLAGGASATAPTASHIGQLYRDTSTGIWYRWNGTEWQEDAAGFGTTLDGGSPSSSFGGPAMDGGTP